MGAVEIIAAVAALGLGVQPAIKAFNWAKGFLPTAGGQDLDDPKVTYQQAILALSIVRARVVDTEKLSEAQKKAFDAITLALVDGSDSP
jgi:hypothetical protein